MAATTKSIAPQRTLKARRKTKTFTAECAESAESRREDLDLVQRPEEGICEKALIRPTALQRECSEDCVSSTLLQNDHYRRHHGCLYSHLTFSDFPVLGPA